MLGTTTSTRETRRRKSSSPTNTTNRAEDRDDYSMSEERSAKRQKRSQRQHDSDDDEDEDEDLEERVAPDSKRATTTTPSTKPTPLSPSRAANRAQQQQQPPTPQHAHAPKTPSSLRKAVLPATRSLPSSPTDEQENRATKETTATSRLPPTAPQPDSPSSTSRNTNSKSKKPSPINTSASTISKSTALASPPLITPANPPDATQGNITPSHPRPSLDPALSRAKRNLRRSSKPLRLVGREQERETLTRAFTNAQSGIHTALYVAGCPGSGKTALVHDILAKINERASETMIAKEEKEGLRVIFVNCMSMQNPAMVWARILEEMGEKVPTGKGMAVKEVERIVLGGEEEKGKGKGKKKNKGGKEELQYLLILDEIDYLASHSSTLSSASSSDTDSDALVRIFSWPRRPNTKITVVGIANALDLAERACGRLKMAGWEPEVLRFAPYTAEEIVKIVEDRVGPGIFMSQAVLLAAKKVAGTGDLRKALDVCRQAIELVEADLRRKSLEPASPTTPTHQGQSATPQLPLIQQQQQGPKVTLRHVNAVTTASLGAASSQSDKVRGLTFVQKAMLVALFLASRKLRVADNKGRLPTQGVTVTLRQAFAEFDQIAVKKLGIPTVSRTELQDVVMALQTYSLVVRSTTGKSKTLVGTPKDTDAFRLEVSDKAIKIGLEDPISVAEEEAVTGKAGGKVLLKVMEEQERVEKRATMLGAQGEDLAGEEQG